MERKLTLVGRKRDKIKNLFGLRPQTSQAPQSSTTDLATTSANVPDLDLRVIQTSSSKQPERVFARSESFTRDMALLSVAYILQESSELRKLIHLLVVIRNEDSEGKLTEVLETCVRFSIQLASAIDAHRGEATQAIIAFNETVVTLRAIQLGSDSRSVGESMSMISNDIIRIKPPFIGNGDDGSREALSKVLDITIGPTASILSVVKEASSLIPVPWVQPLIGTVAGLLKAVSQTRSNYKDMRQIAATAGEFVVSCAVLCSENTVGLPLASSLKKFSNTLGSIAGECDKLRKINLLTRYLQQNEHMGDLQTIKAKLDAAIQLFQTENSINIKMDTKELSRKIDVASLNNLPSHPRYTPNEYLEKSRDDVIQYFSEWIANAQESVLWVHGGAGLGKSTATQELVRLLKSEDRLAGGIFLTNLAMEAPERVVQMISRQLGANYPQTVSNIAEAARKLDGPHDTLEEYFKAYLYDPVQALKYPYQLVAVIDGLEEWRNHESFLAELARIPSPSPLKFILTSRFNYSIERVVDKMPNRKYPLPPASQEVIERYFHNHFSSGEINWRSRIPDNGQIRRLAARADGLLIWAATARSLIMNKFDTRYPHQILDEILSLEGKVVGQEDGTGDGRLEHLYHSAITTLFPSRIQGKWLRTFLAATIVLQEALTIEDFAHLSDIPAQITEEIHQRLAALQMQGDPKTKLISPAAQRFHASFIEFLITESGQHNFQAISIAEVHHLLAKGCLKTVFNEFLPSFRGKSCNYSELRGVEQYAIKYWPLHLSSGTPDETSTQPGGRGDMDIISEDAMRHWAAFFLPCIASRFQDGHDSLDGIQRSALPYKVAIMIGHKDVTTLSYHINCLQIATRINPLDFETWQTLGLAYESLYAQSQSNIDLDDKINAFRNNLKLAPQPYRFLSLNNLANSLRIRFERRGALTDLDEAISMHQEALLLCPAPHPGHLMSLSNLASAFHTRFEKRGATKDLNEAISLQREALLLCQAPHPDRSTSLNDLAHALHTRFKQWGASHDLDEAISLHQEALLLRPALHPNRFMSLNNLAVVLQTRFQQRGSSNDLDEAISLHQEALLLRPAPHQDRFSLLNNIANTLQNRFRQQGSSNDLDEAISLHQEALLLCPGPHPGRFMSLNNLANTLRIRFEQHGASNDLDQAISMYQEALLFCLVSHLDRPKLLSNLASSFHTRFEKRGATNDLNEAISLHREALFLRPTPHSDHSDSLFNLANALQTRFVQRGASDDLNEAISLHKEALLLRTTPHPNRSGSLNNLANALQTRFHQRGASNDLNEAILLHREALLLRPAPHQDRVSSLNNLANTLQIRFKKQGSSNDMDEAISLHQEALLLCPAPHPGRSMSLNNIANDLQIRFEQHGASNDLNEAISLHREALLLRPAPHPDRPSSLNNLAIALKNRFNHCSTSNDLDEAILLHREAILLCPANHLWHSALLRNLDIALSLKGDAPSESALSSSH